MNTAVRTLTAGLLTPTWLIKSLLSREQYGVGCLFGVVIVSALAVVYVANQSRMMTETVAAAHAYESQLDVEYGQLLLEQATYSTQARVQEIAATQLGMRAPTTVVTIHE